MLRFWSHTKLGQGSENAWLAWWHDHRQSTKINKYPGELSRMN
jgi:hypothetical protein